MKTSSRILGTLSLWLIALVAHASTVTYVYTDLQGTPLAEADATGTITARFDYAPYGAASTASGMSGAPNGPGYTGHVNDPESGFVYMQARYYDPVVGRFLSVDPVSPVAADAFNFGRYTYANNNPVVNLDPNGKISWDDVKAWILPTTTQLGSRGVPGTTNDNINGALKQLANQELIGLAFTPGGPGWMGNVPQISVANNELGGASTVELGTAVIGSVAGLAGRGEAAGTTLFRAVSHAEYSDILTTGAFRPGAGSFEFGKFFAESGELAAQWGNSLEGAGNFRVVQADFAKSAADQFKTFARLDNIGPARFATYEQLGQPTIKLWPGSP